MFALVLVVLIAPGGGLSVQASQWGSIEACRVVAREAAESVRDIAVAGALAAEIEGEPSRLVVRGRGRILAIASCRHTMV